MSGSAGARVGRMKENADRAMAGAIIEAHRMHASAALHPGFPMSKFLSGVCTVRAAELEGTPSMSSFRRIQSVPMVPVLNESGEVVRQAPHMVGAYRVSLAVVVSADPALCSSKMDEAWALIAMAATAFRAAAWDATAWVPMRHETSLKLIVDSSFTAHVPENGRAKMWNFMLKSGHVPANPRAIEPALAQLYNTWATAARIMTNPDSLRELMSYKAALQAVHNPLLTALTDDFSIFEAALITALDGLPMSTLNTLLRR